MNLSHILCNACGYKAGEIEFINFHGYYRCPCCQAENLTAFNPPEYTDYAGMSNDPYNNDLCDNTGNAVHDHC